MVAFLLLAVLCAGVLSGCSERDADGVLQPDVAVTNESASAEESDNVIDKPKGFVSKTDDDAKIESKVDEASPEVELQEDEMGKELRLSIGDEEISVAWENNESVDALKELAGNDGLTVQMSMYGGFEQVGSLGSSLPRDDKQITTSAGDIVLYSGNQIVLFYGSNSWAYTRLGKMDKSASELKELLGNGDVTVVIKE